MEPDENSLTKPENNMIAIKLIKKDISNLKKIIYTFVLVTFFILLSFILSISIITNFKLTKNQININNICKLKNELIKEDKRPFNINCSLIQNKLYNRSQPFEYEEEFLFFTDLISCNIPFSFIRFGDGENTIMKGDTLTTLDKWSWNSTNKKFRESLIESASICINNNSFIGIPCKNWVNISESILSFSKCTSTKYMTYATLFINKNYKIFKNWIIEFINSTNRWKIILIANSNINLKINWVYRFFPIPTHLVESWDNYSPSLLSKLSELAKKNNLIFFVSAGPAANIIISYLVKINDKNIYIDFGSSIEFITKGYSTRSYSRKGSSSLKSCENFILKNKSVIYV